MGQAPWDFVALGALWREIPAPTNRAPPVDATPAAPRARLGRAAGKDTPDRGEPLKPCSLKACPAIESSWRWRWASHEMQEKQ